MLRPDKRLFKNHHCLGASLYGHSKCLLYLVSTWQIDWESRDVQRSYGILGSGSKSYELTEVCWIEEYGDTRRLRGHLFEKRHSLGNQFRSHYRYPSDVPTRTGEAVHESGFHGVSDVHQDDRDRGSRLLGGESLRRVAD